MRTSINCVLIVQHTHQYTIYGRSTPSLITLLEGEPFPSCSSPLFNVTAGAIYVTANSEEFSYYLSDTSILTDLEGKPFHYVQQYCPMSLQVQCNCKVVLSSSATIYIYITCMYFIYNTIQYNTYIYI